MKLIQIKVWLNENITPLAWQRVVMRKLPEMREQGLFYHTLTDEAELNREMVSILNEGLKEVYQKELPKEIFNPQILENQ
ncbi:MAG: hypothetical protein ACI85I_001845 [Arenicella sp.]|jgi:hypothetical protein